MYELSLSVIILQKSWIERLIFWVIGILCTLTLIAYIEDFPIKQLLLLATFGTFSITSFYAEIRSMHYKPFKEIGIIKIDEQNITVQVKAAFQTIPLKEINKIRLEVNETALDWYPKGLFNRKKHGTNNFIEVRKQDDQYFKWQIYIENAEKITEVDTFISKHPSESIQCYRKGRKVNSILDEHYKSYPKEHFQTSGNRMYKN